MRSISAIASGTALCAIVSYCLLSEIAIIHDKSDTMFFRCSGDFGSGSKSFFSGERLLVSSAPDNQLAARLVQLGELGVGEVGDVAREIGMRLLRRGGETNREGAKDAKEGEEEDAEAWLNQGNEQLMAGDFEDAIVSFDKVIEIKPDYHEAWNNRGLALGNLGRFEEVIASYDKALEIKHDDHITWNGRGITLCDHLQRYPEAIASFNKAIKIS